MSIGLNVGERMIVLGILPKEGTYITLQLIRGLNEKLGLTAHDLQEFEITEEHDNIHWNEKGSLPIEYTFIPIEVDLIKKQLLKLDSEGTLHQEMISVYEKFMVI